MWGYHVVRSVAKLNIEYNSLHQDILGKVNEHQNPLAQAFAVAGWPVRFKRDSEIQGEGELAEYFYQIETGAARSYKLTGDGRRQILAFHLAGDVLVSGSNLTRVRSPTSRCHPPSLRPVLSQAERARAGRRKA